MKNLTIIGFLFFLSGITACVKSSPQDPTQTVTGMITVVDENDRVVPGFSGITISVENSNPSVTMPVTGNGEFEFPALPQSGSFVLIFSKDGYGTVKQYYSRSIIDSIKNGSIASQNIVLLPKSSVMVNSFTGHISNGKFYYTCNVSTSNSSLVNGVTLIFKKNNPQISLTDFYGNTGASHFITIPVKNGVNSDSICINRTVECNCDFINSGDNLSIKAYGNTISKFGNCYFNMHSKNLFFPGINENTNSGTLSFIIP